MIAPGYGDIESADPEQRAFAIAIPEMGSAELGRSGR